MAPDGTLLRVLPSQYPAAVSAALVRSLRTREVDHRFHYAGYKQVQQWIALFQCYSPFVNDPRCRDLYAQACRAAAEVGSSQRADSTSPQGVHVVGLGCGSGDKDIALLQALRKAGLDVCYTPVDISMPLVVLAHSKAAAAGFQTRPGMVGDVLSPLPWDNATDAKSGRLIATFFGMLPNFEPAVVLPNLRASLGVGDCVLLSANLVATADRAGLAEVLPQYDNRFTNEWLLTFLVELGVRPEDGDVRWISEPDPVWADLYRLSAYFEFKENRIVAVEGQPFGYERGARIRLFFSYRYTFQRLGEILAEYGIAVQGSWATAAEAVLLCKIIG